MNKKSWLYHIKVLLIGFLLFIGVASIAVVIMFLVFTCPILFIGSLVLLLAYSLGHLYLL